MLNNNHNHNRHNLKTTQKCTFKQNMTQFPLDIDKIFI